MIGHAMRVNDEQRMVDNTTTTRHIESSILNCRTAVDNTMEHLLYLQTAVHAFSMYIYFLSPNYYS